MTTDCLPPAIETAEIEWQDGHPKSKRFGDIYFSKHNGLDEARYVFLEGKSLAKRFARVPEAGHFVVAEAGFGTGLNFLTCWQLWKAVNSQPCASLHYLSVERYPLERRELARALALWPELAGLASELLDQYPPMIRGTHRLVLDGGRVRLTLYFGDISALPWQPLPLRARFAGSLVPPVSQSEKLAVLDTSGTCWWVNSAIRAARITPRCLRSMDHPLLMLKQPQILSRPHK